MLLFSHKLFSRVFVGTEKLYSSPDLYRELPMASLFILQCRGTNFNVAATVQFDIEYSADGSTFTAALSGKNFGLMPAGDTSFGINTPAFTPGPGCYARVAAYLDNVNATGMVEIWATGRGKEARRSSMISMAGTSGLMMPSSQIMMPRQGIITGGTPNSIKASIAARGMSVSRSMMSAGQGVLRSPNMSRGMSVSRPMMSAGAGVIGKRARQAAMGSAMLRATPNIAGSAKGRIQGKKDCGGDCGCKPCGEKQTRGKQGFDLGPIKLIDHGECHRVRDRGGRSPYETSSEFIFSPSTFYFTSAEIAQMESAIAAADAAYPWPPDPVGCGGRCMDARLELARPRQLGVPVPLWQARVAESLGDVSALYDRLRLVVGPELIGPSQAAAIANFIATYTMANTCAELDATPERALYSFGPTLGYYRVPRTLPLPFAFDPDPRWPLELDEPHNPCPPGQALQTAAPIPLAGVELLRMAYEDTNTMWPPLPEDRPPMDIEIRNNEWLLQFEFALTSACRSAMLDSECHAWGYFGPPREAFEAVSRLGSFSAQYGTNDFLSAFAALVGVRPPECA